MEVTEISTIIYTKNGKTKSINSMYQFLSQRRNIFKENDRINIITFLRKTLSNKRKIYLEKRFGKLKDNIDTIYFKNVDFIKELDLVCDNTNVEVILENCSFYNKNLRIKGGKVKIINPKFKNKTSNNKITINCCEKVDIELNEEDISIEITQSNKVMLNIKSSIKDLFISTSSIYLKNIQKVDSMYLNGKKEILLDNCNLPIGISKFLYAPKLFLKNSKLIGTFNINLPKTFLVLKNSFIKVSNKLNINDYLLDENSYLEDSEFLIRKENIISKKRNNQDQISNSEKVETKVDYYKIYEKLDRIDSEKFYESDKSKTLTNKNHNSKKVRKKVKVLLSNIIYQS